MKYGGIIGPLMFFTMVLVIGWLRPDYSHMNQLMSELGETGGTYSQAFNYSGFLINGLAILLFGVYLTSDFRRRNLSIAVPVLLMIHGLGMLAATWARCDTGCPAQGTTSQLLHNIIAGIKFPALVFSALILGIQLYRHKLSKSLGIVSLAVFFASIALMGKFTMAAEVRELAGLWQRLFLAVIYGWLIGISIHFARSPYGSVTTSPSGS